MADKHPTEAAYDEHMAPLIAQLIRVAQDANIPLLVWAGMELQPDVTGGCLTLVRGYRKGANNRMGLCAGILRGDARFDSAAGLMITRFHPGGVDHG